MKPRISEDLDEILECLSYNPETGVFTWLRSVSGRARIGAEAGSSKNKRYRQITYNGMDIYAHRIAWRIVYGEWPSLFVDHINGDRYDNRIANLRLATPSQNARHMQVRPGRTYKGVYFDKRCGRWGARICADRKNFKLGRFNSVDDAARAYDAAAIKLHGEFACLNFPPEAT